MVDANKAFVDELEIFRTEAESAAQFLYGYLAIHETATRHSPPINARSNHVAADAGPVDHEAAAAEAGTLALLCQVDSRFARAA